MTGRPQSTPVAEALELVAELGFEGMAAASDVLLDGTMNVQRAELLGGNSYERTVAYRGYANGFKPESVDSRPGKLELRVPQVRDVDDRAWFYPSALERGERTEEALELALAEICIQRVSTRKVTAIAETFSPVPKILAHQNTERNRVIVISNALSNALTRSPSEASMQDEQSTSRQACRPGSVRAGAELDARCRRGCRRDWRECVVEWKQEKGLGVTPMEPGCR